MLSRVERLIGKVERLEARSRALKLMEEANALLRRTLEKAKVFTGV